MGARYILGRPLSNMPGPGPEAARPASENRQAALFVPPPPSPRDPPGRSTTSPTARPASSDGRDRRLFFPIASHQVSLGARGIGDGTAYPFPQTRVEADPVRGALQDQLLCLLLRHQRTSQQTPAVDALFLEAVERRLDRLLPPTQPCLSSCACSCATFWWNCQSMARG